MATDAPSTRDMPDAKGVGEADAKGEGEAERAAAKAAERIYRVWSEPEEGNLIAGVSTLGVGNWEAIRLDPAYNLTQRSALQLKDKWRNLVKYKHVAPEDFPTYADVCRRRRTEALLALAPTISLRLARNPQNFSASSFPAEKRKRPRASSPEPSSSFNDSQTSRHENLQSKIRHEAESARSGPILTPAVSQALEKVRIAKDFVREALLIQRDANAVASKAMAASTESGGDLVQIKETIRSANIIASLAQEKSRKSRWFLEDALDNLSRAQKAATAVVQQPKKTRADADDTAHSSCKSPRHIKVGSPEDCGTSVEVPALAGSSGTPEQLSEEMEHEVHDFSHKDDAAFSNNNIFEKYGLDDWVSLVLDEAGSDLSDADALNHGAQDIIANCDDFRFHH